MIPVYIIWHRLGMINTLYPLILPSFLGSAFFIFMLSSSSGPIPAERWMRLESMAVVNWAS